MPWKECEPVSERMRFIARLDQGERMTDVCREFGISRKTGSLAAEDPALAGCYAAAISRAGLAPDG